MRAIVRYAPLAIVAALWEFLSRSGLVSQKLLPSFSQTMVALAGLITDGSILQNGIESIWRALAGFIAAVIVGMAIGGAMALIAAARTALNPLVQIFYPLPKSALIPLVLVWFGLGDLSKTFLVFLGCLLPMILSTYNGLRGVDPVLAWSAESLGATRLQIVREILLPAAMPQILTGIRTTIAFMFLLMVSSELVIATNGLGFMIGMLGDNGAYPAMFAVILTVTALGFAADRGFLAVTRHLLRWRE